jgi:hypothetical protein
LGKGLPIDGFGITLSPRTEKLVFVFIDPYKYSINPMVFGVFMCYFSVDFFSNWYEVTTIPHNI